MKAGDDDRNINDVPGKIDLENQIGKASKLKSVMSDDFEDVEDTPMAVSGESIRNHAICRLKQYLFITEEAGLTTGRGMQQR